MKKQKDSTEQADMIILTDLYNSIDEGIYAYTFYEKYKYGPAQVYRFIDKYEKKGILTYGAGKITITTKGKKLFDADENQNCIQIYSVIATCLETHQEIFQLGFYRTKSALIKCVNKKLTELGKNLETVKLKLVCDNLIG